MYYICIMRLQYAWTGTTLYQSLISSAAGTVGKSFPGRLILPGTYEHTQESNPTGKPLKTTQI